MKNLRNRGVGHTLRRGRDRGDPTLAGIPRKAWVILPFRGRHTGSKSARDRETMKTLGLDHTSGGPASQSETVELPMFTFLVRKVKVAGRNS